MLIISPCLVFWDFISEPTIAVQRRKFLIIGFSYVLLCPWDSPDKNTAVGSRALLQGIFPTQELNLYLQHLQHCSQVFYPLNHLESPLAH